MAIMSNAPTPIDLAELVSMGRQFWATEGGRAVRRAERACLGPMTERWAGVHGLEMSLGAPIVDMSTIPHLIRWSPTRKCAESSSTLVCHPDALPLPNGCLDLVVLHHVLEVMPEPHHVLQEAARVTAPGGRLIIVSWSPLSPAGMTRCLPGRRQRLPGQGSWRRPGRLRDWLAFVEFEIERLDYCGFHLPGMAPRNALLETLGRRHNLPMGDSYIIQARSCSRLARHQPQRPLFGAVVGATRLGGVGLDSRSRDAAARTNQGRTASVAQEAANEDVGCRCCK